MRDRGFDQLPVSSPANNRLVGLVTLGNLLSYLSSGRAGPDTAVAEAMFDFRRIDEVVTDPTDAQLTATTAGAGRRGSVSSTRRGKRRPFVEITRETPLSALSRFFEWNSAAVVTERSKGAEAEEGDRGLRAVAVVTKVDLLTWLVRREKANGGK